MKFESINLEKFDAAKLNEEKAIFVTGGQNTFEVSYHKGVPSDASNKNDSPELG